MTELTITNKSKLRSALALEFTVIFVTVIALLLKRYLNYHLGAHGTTSFDIALSAGYLLGVLSSIITI